MYSVRALALSVAVFLVSNLPAFAYTLDLSQNGDRYYFNAVRAPLVEVLKAINRAEGGRLEFFDQPDRPISCRYQYIEVDDLLSRLRVNYTWVLSENEEDRVLEGELFNDGRLALLSGEARAAIAYFLLNLRHDGIPGNAMKSFWQLCPFVPEIVPVLETAMLAGDYQERHAAASLLRTCHKTYVPSEEMLSLTMDLLNADNYDPDWYGLIWQGEAYSWLRDATNHYYRFRSRLVENLNSSEPNERVRSALLLGEFGEHGLGPRLARMLTPHLKDNRLAADGCLAAYALYKLGPVVKPYLEPLVEGDDFQASSFAELILHHFEQPGDTNAVLRHFMSNTSNRNPLMNRPRLTSSYFWSQGRFPNRNGVYGDPAMARAGGFSQATRYGTLLPEKHPISPAPNLRKALGQPAPEPPAYSPGLSFDEAPMEYTILTGDTWEEISKLFIVPLSLLLDMNPDYQYLETPIPNTTIWIPPPML